MTAALCPALALLWPLVLGRAVINATMRKPTAGLRYPRTSAQGQPTSNCWRPSAHRRRFFFLLRVTAVGYAATAVGSPNPATPGGPQQERNEEKYFVPKRQAASFAVYIPKQDCWSSISEAGGRVSRACRGLRLPLVPATRTRNPRPAACRTGFVWGRSDKARQPPSAVTALRMPLLALYVRLTQHKC